jgi:CelD/BcsL family acetyltransferase involved in cellulose biosynthesis
MKLHTISTTPEFAGLKGEWNALLLESCNPAIVQTWEWMKTWWDVYGDGKELRIACARIENALVGLAPFAIDGQKRRHFKILPYRSMWLLGSGRTAGRGVASDYLDLIVRKGCEEEFTKAIVEFLLGSAEWEEVVLANVDENSVVLRHLKRLCARHGLDCTLTNRAPSMLVRLPRTWDEFLESIPGGLRYKITRGRREFAKAGGEYHLVADASQLPGVFAELESLHQERWQSRGVAGAFSCKSWKSFHEKLLPLVLENGWLKMSYLRLAGKTVAVNYNFAFGGKIHFFQSGVVPHENKHIRLGLLLHSFCIEEAIREGFVEYDFLKVGGSGAGYKDMWANHARDLVDVRISRNTAKEKTLVYLTKAAHAAKQLKRKLAAAVRHADSR